MNNQEHITPASGQRAEILDRMLELARRLPEIIGLERSGVRDGNGYWHSSDALSTAEDLGKAYRELREVETEDENTPPPRQGYTTGTLIWVGGDGEVITIPRVLEDNLQYAQFTAPPLGGDADEIPF